MTVRTTHAPATLSRSTTPDRHGALLPAGLIIVGGATLGLLAGAVATGASVSPTTWYLARASGFTLYLLFWLAVVSGLGLTTTLLDPLGGRATLWAAHRVATELGFVLLALHLLSLAIDPAVPLGVRGVLVPFASDVRQPWTDLGIVAAYGALGLGASFALRRFIGQRGWRLLHYGAFPLWAIALVHGLGSGSDSAHPWAIVLYGATTAVVLFFSIYRLLRFSARAEPPVAPRGSKGA